MSTANLVPSECSEAGDDHNTTQQARKSTSAHAASGAPNRAPKQVQEYEGKKKKKKAGSGPGLKDEGKGGKADEEEEFPGSPSFRFYTEGPWVNNDSADASGHGKDQGITFSMFLSLLLLVLHSVNAMQSKMEKRSDKFHYLAWSII